MKQNDIKIGSVYLTRIGGALCAVRVVAEARRRFNFERAKDTGPKRYRVRRVEETTDLPKARTAAALREIPAQLFHMKDQPWEVRVQREYENSCVQTAVRSYEVTIPAFEFAVHLHALSAAEAAVFASRAMLARACFPEGFGNFTL